MKILGLDSSGLVASVAIIEDGEMRGEYTINYKKTHSQTLLPMLDEIVKMLEFDLETIDAIAVAGGPGSFTGLRIGSATAKGLGLALNKPLIHIPTVDGMAYQLFGNGGLICPIMDARRNQVYTGIYRFEKDFEIVSLIKPQFEAGKEQVGKNGVVREKEIHIEVINNILDFCTSHNLYVKDFTFSPIKGPEGNIEYLAYIKKSVETEKITDEEILAIVEKSHENLDK